MYYISIALRSKSKRSKKKTSCYIWETAVLICHHTLPFVIVHLGCGHITALISHNFETSPASLILFLFLALTPSPVILSSKCFSFTSSFQFLLPLLGSSYHLISESSSLVILCLFSFPFHCILCSVKRLIFLKDYIDYNPTFIRAEKELPFFECCVPGKTFYKRETKSERLSKLPEVLTGFKLCLSDSANHVDSPTPQN